MVGQRSWAELKTGDCHATDQCNWWTKPDVT